MGLCNICFTEMKLDKHHIWSTSYGGPNKSWNRCKLCPNCHKKVHYGKLIIEGWFTTSKGERLVYRKENEPSVTDIIAYPVWIYPNVKNNFNNPFNTKFNKIYKNLEKRLNTINKVIKSKPKFKFKQEQSYNLILFKTKSTKKEIKRLFKNLKGFKVKKNKIYKQFKNKNKLMITIKVSKNKTILYIYLKKHNSQIKNQLRYFNIF